MIHAKLIRNGDFSKTIEIDSLTQEIHVPILNKCSPTILANYSLQEDLLNNIQDLCFYLDTVEKVGSITFAVYRER